MGRDEETKAWEGTPNATAEDGKAQEPVIEMRDIVKRFGDFVANDHVQLKLHKGEVLAILGENGAGKSTLMNILYGMLRPSSGEILVRGQKVEMDSPEKAISLGIGMVHQHFMLIPPFTVAENIILGAEPMQGLTVDLNGAKKKIRELSEQYHLMVDVDAKVEDISVGMQQRVEILKVLYRGADILILDEPTAALPEKEVEILFSTIRKLKSRGITIILISHKMDEVFSLCDRLCVIRNGKTIATHDIHEVSLEQVVEEMIGHSIGTMYPKEDVEIGEELLRVEHLTIRHPFNYHKNILEDVSFTLHAGEILGLEGLVGSGRTELMRALYGQGDVLTGDIYVKGKKMDIRSPKNAIQNGIVLITEERRSDGFIGMMSIKKNVSLSSLHKISRHNILCPILENKFVNEYMEKLRIKAPSTEVAVENLSGGNQQKVVISKCLLADPSILMMDEPTRGVDVGAKTEIYKIMNEQARQGKGIIMTSSERAELLNMTDRMIVIGKSKVQGVLEHDEYDEKRIVALAAQ